jgi:hypothetical protein
MERSREIRIDPASPTRFEKKKNMPTDTALVQAVPSDGVEIGGPTNGPKPYIFPVRNKSDQAILNHLSVTGLCGPTHGCGAQGVRRSGEILSLLYEIVSSRGRLARHGSLGSLRTLAFLSSAALRLIACGRGPLVAAVGCGRILRTGALSGCG